MDLNYRQGPMQFRYRVAGDDVLIIDRIACEFVLRKKKKTYLLERFFRQTIDGNTPSTGTFDSGGFLRVVRKLLVLSICVFCAIKAHPQDSATDCSKPDAALKEKCGKKQRIE